MQDHKSYADYVKEWAKRHPLDAKGYVEIKKGKIVQEDFTTLDAKKTKKLTNKPYREFNYQKPYIAPVKLCAHCGNKFEKPMRMSFKDWGGRKHCSNTCRTLSKAK